MQLSLGPKKEHVQKLIAEAVNVWKTYSLEKSPRGGWVGTKLSGVHPLLDSFLSGKLCPKVDLPTLELSHLYVLL